MAIFRAIKSAVNCAGHWIGETYCALGEKITERIERVSDSVAEQRYLADRQVKSVRNSQVTSQHVIEIKSFRVINGHQHLD